MINYIIINGTNSNTINGLGINELPPISKPPLRVQTEEIDGRDGDISTNLGYGAYDKTISIGLFGTGYDINEVISFFNGEGTVVFSNEPNKYYKYKIINQIDYEALLKFKSATITFHCQPFKYPLEETPLEIEYEYIEQEGVESATMNNTNGGTSLKINLKGNTSQYSTTGKNLCNRTATETSNLRFYFTRNNLTKTITLSFTTNVALSGNTIYLDKSVGGSVSVGSIGGSANTRVSKSFTIADDIFEDLLNSTWYSLRIYKNGAEFNLPTDAQIENGSDMTPYEEYTGGIASPNPDYPQQIHEVSGDNEVVVRGKNLFNKNDIVDNVYISTSGAEVANNNYFSSNYIYAKDIDKITISGSYDSSQYGELRIILFNENKQRIDYYSFYNRNINVSSATYIRFSDVKEHKDTIQLEIGQTATPFQPYQSQTYPIELGERFNVNKLEKGSYDGTQTNKRVHFYGKMLSSGDVVKVKIFNSTYKYAVARAISNISSGSNNVYQDSGWQTGEYTFTSNGSGYFYLGIARTDNGDFSPSDLKYNDFSIVYGDDTPIELCKIGDYQDYFTKNSSGQWCKYNAIGKVVLDGSESWSRGSNGAYYLSVASLGYSKASGITCMSNYFLGSSNTTSSSNVPDNKIAFYNGANAGINELFCGYRDKATASDFETWLSTHNTIVYYVLNTPYLSLIEDETLISQLDNIQNAMSYDGTTNISQVNNDKPFLLDLIAMEKGTDEVVINNIGNVYAKPTIALEGTGETDIYLNNTEILKVDLSEKNKITIDTNNMEAYDPTDNSLANRKVIGNYNSMTLPSGNTTMKITGALTKATITDYTRWL